MGKQIGWMIFLVVVVVVLIAIRAGVFSNRISDQALIEQSLTESLQAAKEGRSGVVLDFISNRFQVSTGFPIDRKEIAKYVRENHPEVEVVNKQAVVSGDQATIQTPVRVKIQFMPGNSYSHEFKDVQLTFKKENSLQWLIFPTKQWRLLQVDSNEVINESLLTQ